jgi:hypothetical protein
LHHLCHRDQSNPAGPTRQEVAQCAAALLAGQRLLAAFEIGDLRRERWGRLATARHEQQNTHHDVSHGTILTIF